MSEEVVVKVEGLVDYEFGLEQDLSEPIRSCDILNSSGIYAIVNKVNGKCYIGSAKCLKVRLKKHIYDLNNAIHPNKHLQASYEKHSIANFKIKILDIIPYTEDLYLVEQMYFDILHPEYNICPIAGSTSGRTMSEYHKKKISLARKGIKFSDETRLKMSASRKGIKFSDTHKLRISENSKKHNRVSGKGIKQFPNNKYGVIISHKWLGTFDTYEQALAIRLLAEEVYWVDENNIDKSKLDKLNSLITRIPKKHVSGLGILLTKNGTYKASISVKNKKLYLGIFKTYDEALTARLEAEKKYWID